MTEKLVFLTIALLPLYVLRAKFMGVPTTLLEVLIVISILSWVVSYFRTEEPLQGLVGAFKTPLLLPSLLFLLASFLSLFLTTDFLKGLGLFRAYILEPWLLFTITYDVFKEKPKQVLKALVISALVVCLPALAQAITHRPLFDGAAHELLQGRVAGFYNSANSVALYLGPLAALLLVLFLKPVAFVGRNFGKISLGVFLITISLTNSLGSFLALIGVLVLYLIYFLIRDQKKFQQKLFKILMILVVLVSSAYFLFLFEVSTFTPRTGLVYPRTFVSTQTIRLCLWEGTRNYLLHNPLGGGLSSFPTNYEKYRTCDTELLQYPHNLFLNFWVEVGLFGLITFIYLVFVFVKLVVNSSVDGWVKMSLVSFLMYLFIHGLFDVPYFKNDLSAQFWVFLAFGLLIVGNSRREKEV